jgi:hypothetical protein
VSITLIIICIISSRHHHFTCAVTERACMQALPYGYLLERMSHPIHQNPFRFHSVLPSRFVGLLLAINTLPRNDLQAIEEVHEAAGPAFFDRLLLPLHRHQVERKAFHAVGRKRSGRNLEPSWYQRCGRRKSSRLRTEGS